jgi:predicted MFS family arabinose efflux permease
VPPTLVLLTVLTENCVHPAVLTQAFTWNNSASAAGSALAAFLAGRTADELGASAAFALAPVAGLALLVLSVAARHRVTSAGRRS